MLRKVVLSQDRRQAWIVCDEKTWTMWHSEGRVMELVDEMVLLQPIARSIRSEEKTEEIEIQLSLFKDAA